jgi:putative membrane protein
MAQKTLRPETYYFFLILATAAWSVWRPHDMFTWVMEAAPVMVVLPLLVATRKKFPLTHLLYFLTMLHCLLLLTGAHYTYAEVPLFNWLRDEYGLGRNHFDRLGHFMQGFVPAMAGRELLLRTSKIGTGKWLVGALVLSCLGISAIYEIIEWAASALTGEAADSFLGTQGDVWDTQKDMLLAGIGAITALLLLSRRHDRELKKL